MSWKYLHKSRLQKAQMYEILRAPMITEKATLATGNNQIMFRVAPHAAKSDIRAAVEGLFDVKVVAVNTVNSKGKVKRFRGKLGVRKTTRKAIVTLAAGDSIDLGVTL